jgi:hypothetical protein
MELSLAIKQAVQQRELTRESSNLSETVRHQSSILENLENQNPGITKVDRDTSGAICIPDVEYDLDTLIQKTNK